MTIETEDVVAGLRKRAAWQRENLGDMLDCGTAWPELERAADLIQSLSERIAVLEGEKAARERDWWKPEPGDPFYMIEAEDSEWLRNEDSFLGTRDATKALRFPTARKAEEKLSSLRMIGASGTKWFYAKATEHAWIEP